MDYNKESLILHRKLQGKIEMNSRHSIQNSNDLSLVYSPGVAAPSLEIYKNPEMSYVYTRRANVIAVISDGSAVLGLGDIGAEASMPVMEGKAVLFKQLGGVDAIPLCLKTNNTDEIVHIIHALSGSFGGVNLEDISAPRCFEIERRLKEICDIPIFHDDQHGTAIVTLAALINSLRLAKKRVDNVKIVINGIGSAGTSIARFLLTYGFKNLVLVDKEGILQLSDSNINDHHRHLARLTNPNDIKGGLKEALVGADVFIGVSVPDILPKEAIKVMNTKPIIFALANPKPEISYQDAKDGGAFIVGSGLSNFPNQINNLLTFPGIFRGALDARASDINDDMKLAAANAIADQIPLEKLNPDYIIPNPLDPVVHKAVATAVEKAAKESNVSRSLNFNIEGNKT